MQLRVLLKGNGQTNPKRELIAWAKQVQGQANDKQDELGIEK